MKRKIIAALGTLTIILSAGHNASAATKSGDINISFILTAAAACTVVTTDPVFDDVGGGTTNQLAASTHPTINIDCGLNDVPSHTLCVGGTGGNERYLNRNGAVDSNYSLVLTDAAVATIGTAGAGCVGHGLTKTYDAGNGRSYTLINGNTTYTHNLMAGAVANVGMLPEGLYEATIPYAVVF
jgi:hypothetical protein